MSTTRNSPFQFWVGPHHQWRQQVLCHVQKNGAWRIWGPPSARGNRFSPRTHLYSNNNPPLFCAKCMFCEPKKQSFRGCCLELSFSIWGLGHTLIDNNDGSRCYVNVMYKIMVRGYDIGCKWCIVKFFMSLMTYKLVVPSFRALFGRLKFTVRRHKFNKDSFSSAWSICHQLLGKHVPLGPFGSSSSQHRRTLELVL